MDVRARRRRDAAARRRRRLIVAAVVILLLGAGGAGAGIALTHGGAAPRTLRDNPPRAGERRTKAAPRRSPLPGALLIADRGNNRILLVTPGHRWLWRFPDPQIVPGVSSCASTTTRSSPPAAARSSPMRKTQTRSSRSTSPRTVGCTSTACPGSRVGSRASEHTGRRVPASWRGRDRGRRVQLPSPLDP